MQTRSDGYLVDAFALKNSYFHSGQNNFEVGSEYLGIYRSCISRFLCCNVRILKNRGIVRHTDVISENKR